MSYHTATEGADTQSWQSQEPVRRFKRQWWRDIWVF